MSARRAPLVVPRPWLTYLLLGANLLMFGLCWRDAGSQVLVVVPAETLLVLGANVAPFTQWAGDWQHLCTATFLHGGLMHLGFNCLALWQVGPFVERTVGASRFSVLYVASGLAASAVSMLAATSGWLEAGMAVGASGAICGLIGGSAVLGYRIQGRQSPLARAMLRWLLITVVLGYLITLGSRVHIDNYAHVGGAVFGALCALLFRRGIRYSALGRALRIGLALGVCVVSFVVHGLKLAGPLGEARLRARADYLTGACDELAQELEILRVTGSARRQILARCARDVRVH